MKFLGWFIGVIFIIAVILGCYWLAWQLWCYVVPQIWVTGPANLVRPGFWFFVACAFLLSWIGRRIFYSGKSE